MELIEYAFPGLIGIGILVVTLTAIDPEFEGTGLWQGLKWVGSGLIGFVVAGLRGFPPEITAYVGATTLMWITVFTGFRPGLVTWWPGRDYEGKWIRYENLYCITGWLSIIWTLYILWPVLEPYF